MSRNIKEIGKELMGKSLNSFHRKTGLTQLEKNNEMQDGILDGILSQVDDAYIEKTEQSNVIHLDGSGDGVVVLDSIEGNTMVNILPKFSASSIYYNGKNYEVDNEGYATIGGIGQWVKPFFTNTIKNSLIKHDTIYTIICDVKENTLTRTNTTKNTVFDICSNDVSESLIRNINGERSYQIGETGRKIVTVQTKKESEVTLNADAMYFPRSQVYNVVDNGYIKYRLICLEGDWTNREIPPYFEGLQSSFEEKVNSEGKYEIEILMNNKNLYTYGDLKNWNYDNGTNKAILECVKVQPNTTYTLSKKGEGLLHAIEYSTPKYNYIGNTQYNHNSVYTNRDGMEYKVNNATGYVTFTTGKNINYLWITGSNGAASEEVVNQTEIQLEKGNSKTNYIPHKSNKIKLLINEPLKAVYGKKDRLCIKEGKLTIERNTKQINLTKDLSIVTWKRNDNFYSFGIKISDINKLRFDKVCLSDVFPSLTGADINSYVGEGVGYWDNAVQMCINISSSKLTEYSVSAFKNWLQNNPTKVVYQLEEPIYEEVLNEYGEPILLEGYENGTIYIDSTIVPTTTVRYTPKMESFNVLKEVNNNNIMLTNDVNDNIIPYMMDVDLMIMEKEMALMSQYKIRRIGAKDMTSMQKRTQDMLTRLIKGKTLTEQECKTRVVTYLDAGKITDAQAEELMLLISEVYA